ncbi:RsiV family protein, partial [Terrisporobacter sp.]
AHGIYEYVPYNIDLTSGNTFVLNDIFTQNSNYEQVINDKIKSQIKTLNKEQGLPEDSTQLYAFNKIKNNQKFYIKDDSIVIFFDLYEIAPYVAGVPEFIIKKELINTLLIPKYKEIIFYSSKATTV